VNRILLTFAILTLLGAACNDINRVTPQPVEATSQILPQATINRQPSPLPESTRTATLTPIPSATSQLASPSPAAVIPAGWLSYRDDDYGIELSYPPQGELQADQPSPPRIYLPFADGTNLQEKYLEIVLLRGEGECASPIASGYDPAAIQSERVAINGLEFERQSGGEGAAGNIYIWQVYTTRRGEVCVSLTFVLHSTNVMNYDPPLAEYDEPAEAAVFEQIVSTFRWLP